MNYSNFVYQIQMFTAVISLFCIVAVYVLTSLGYMKCMEKANVEGWKAWVPFYRYFVMYKIVDLAPGLASINVIKFVVSVIVAIVTIANLNNVDSYISDGIREGLDSVQSSGYSYHYSYKNTYTTDSNSTSANPIKIKMHKKITFATLMDYIDDVIGIAAFVVGIFFAIKIKKAYGLSGGYIAGMILVPTIFIMIIGFGKSKYVLNDKPIEGEKA